MIVTVSPQSREIYPTDFFRREDESDDRLFYAQPRLVVHIDQYAISAIRDFFDKHLPRGGAILDLMSSWRSHMPQSFPKAKLVGLGLNAAELVENIELDDRMVHDLNANPSLPFQDQSFDAAVVTVSIQYLIRPVEVFREMNRILKSRGSFHVVYSNRMFATKAIAIWRGLSDPEKAHLIASYFSDSGGWGHPEMLDLSPRLGFYTDPVYVVTSRKNS